jgi:hypothetical protein
MFYFRMGLLVILPGRIKLPSIALLLRFFVHYFSILSEFLVYFCRGPVEEASNDAS